MNFFQEIWHFFLLQQITVTVEYLPGSLNMTANWEPLHVKETSEWKLNHHVFRMIFHVMGLPKKDLYASRNSHEIQTH